MIAHMDNKMKCEELLFTLNKEHKNLDFERMVLTKQLEDADELNEGIQHDIIEERAYLLHLRSCIAELSPEDEKGELQIKESKSAFRLAQLEFKAKGFDRNALVEKSLKLEQTIISLDFLNIAIDQVTAQLKKLNRKKAA